jgi:hypothetical protein
MSDRRDKDSWAKSVSALHVTDVPEGALNLNVEGRRLVGPIQGFGQLWQRTYRVRLTGVGPREVIQRLKTKLPIYQPPENRFYPSLAGVRPGEVLLINATVSGMPVSTGVLVLYADEESFTLMTPQGNPESGWNTFSAYEEDGRTVAQIQTMARTNDPIFEFGFRFMGGSKIQRRIWTHVLRSLAEDIGLAADVEVTDTRVDPSLQWAHARNIWHNSIIRTTLYKLAAPLRWARGPRRPRGAR